MDGSGIGIGAEGSSAYRTEMASKAIVIGRERDVDCEKALVTAIQGDTGGGMPHPPGAPQLHRRRRHRLLNMTDTRRDRVENLMVIWDGHGHVPHTRSPVTVAHRD